MNKVTEELTESAERMQHVIHIALLMGLSLNVKSNFKDSLSDYIVVFNGANTQRVLIDTKLPWDEIYILLGDAMQRYGKIAKCVEISSVLSVW